MNGHQCAHWCPPLTALPWCDFSQRRGCKEGYDASFPRIAGNTIFSTGGAGGLPRRALVARWPRSIGASGSETRYCRDVAPHHYSVSAPPPEYWGRRIGTLLRAVTSSAAKAADRLRRFFPFSAHFFLSEKLRKTGVLPGFRNSRFCPSFLGCFCNFPE